MEIKKFWTVVKGDHKFSGNEYVRGKIHSYKELICDGERDGFNKPAFAWHFNTEDAYWIPTECTQEQYDRFRDLVEKRYPGLCEFDCDMEK